MTEENKDQLFQDEEAPIQEEAQQEELQAQEEEQQEEAKPELSETEKKAKTFGHMSKEDWIAQGRDPNKWKSPEEFTKFGESYDLLKPHIETLKKEISKRDAAIDTISKRLEEIKQAEYKRGMSDLEAQLIAAKRNNDIEAVQRLAQQQATMNLDQEREKQNTLAAERNRVDADFMERNKHWFNDEHPDLQDKARKVGMEIISLYPNASYQEIAAKVERRMEFEHPEIVGRGSKPQQPITPARSQVNKQVLTSAPDSDQKIYQKLSPDLKAEFSQVKAMVEKATKTKYTVSDYVKQLKQRGEI